MAAGDPPPPGSEEKEEGERRRSVLKPPPPDLHGERGGARRRVVRRHAAALLRSRPGSSPSLGSARRGGRRAPLDPRQAPPGSARGREAAHAVAWQLPLCQRQPRHSAVRCIGRERRGGGRRERERRRVEWERGGAGEEVVGGLNRELSGMRLA